MESQYAALKDQLNPHFLFNSLNSLNSLIRLSPQKAIEFVENFSQIYRYVLDMHDKMVVDLQTELEFVNAYYFLQKIRYGDALELEIRLQPVKNEYFLLPLSVQLLIENCIKHNELSLERPLKIVLEKKDNYLVIRNNLQKKIVWENHTGIGQKNLLERYKHFTDEKPLFYIAENEYWALIPLLKELEA